MSQTFSSQPLHLNRDVDALIQHLLAINQRLMDLTGGELDSVADAGGRTFLLQHAQEDVALYEAAKQAAILSALPANIALLDAQGDIISVNEAWRKYAESNVLQSPLHGLGLNYLRECENAAEMNCSEASAVAAGIRAVLAGTAETFSLEYQCHSPTAQNWYLLRVSPLPGTPPQGAVVMHLNFTSERQAEEELRTSESRFRQMAESIGEVFFLIDIANYRMLYVSPAYEAIWGYSCESLYANLESWISVIHPDDRAATEAAFLEGMVAGEFELAYRTIRPDGSIRSIEVCAFPVPDGSGKTARIAGIAQDVSERKRVEKKLHKHEQRYRLLVEATSAMVWDTSASGNFETEQPSWSAFTGQSFAELRGMGWLSAIHPDDQRETARVWSLALASGSTYEVEHRILARDKTWHDMLARAVPIFSEDGAIAQWMGVHSDITERKKAANRIIYLNRVYAMLSSTNMLIVRAQDRDELFNEACQIAVREGGFRMALIAIVDQNSNKIVSYASAGMNEALKSMLASFHLSSAGSASESSLITRVLRERKAVISNSAKDDPALLFGKEYAEAGVCSLAVVPLILGEVLFGVMALCASETNFFHQDEMKLLDELALDIAFGIDHIDKQDELNYLAYYDALTGLANRSLFQDRLSQNLHARDDDPRLIATVLLDLDRFRQVNETLGRSAGDRLLSDVGARLHGANDSAARISADMFGLVMRGEGPPAEIQEDLAALLDECFSKPFTLLSGQELHVACRAGIAFYPHDGADADALMRNAEAALRQSKRSSERIELYAPAMNANMAEAMAIETRLRSAYECHEFVLHYQPKLSLSTGRLCGAEALIRWQDPERGLVAPGLFIAALEKTGLIIEVGCWVVQQVYADLCAWAACGLSVPRIAVNVSAVQLQRKDFVDSMINEIHRGGDRPQLLELEITESLVMANIDNSSRKLALLRDMGVAVTIDDFGTGYSSLSYLAHLPVDILKIDQSFVAGMTDSAVAASIVSTIITLAHGLKLQVVAEGVETEAQSNMLRQLGCDAMQGYLLSVPLPAATFAQNYLSPSTM